MQKPALVPVSPANTPPAIYAPTPSSTQLQREIAADRAFGQLIKRCSKWEKHDETVKDLLYQHLQACAVTLDKTQDNTTSGWFDAAATRTIIKNRYKSVGNSAFDEQDVDSLAQAIIYLAFPSTHYQHLPYGTDEEKKVRNRIRQREWQYTTAIKAAVHAREAHRAADWFKQQGGFKAAAKAYMDALDAQEAAMGSQTAVPPTPSKGSTETVIGQATITQSSLTVFDGEWTVLLVKKNGAARDVYFESQSNKLLRDVMIDAGVTPKEDA